MSASVGNALLPVGKPSMLCWAHSALIGQQLSAFHVWLLLSNLCQAFWKKFKVLDTRAFSLGEYHRKCTFYNNLLCRC